MQRGPFLLCAEGLHSLCSLVLLPRLFWHVFPPFSVSALQVSVSFPPPLGVRSKVGFQSLITGSKCIVSSAHFFGRLLKLIMSTLFRMEVGQSCVLEDFATFGAFDALTVTS